MKAPTFWYQPPGALSALLAPLGAIYDLAGRLLRAQTQALQMEVPVVCVGNLVAGGAGKTPVALAIAERLASWGAAPHFITRGYGGSLAGPERVVPGLHEAADVGDEALLLSALAPTWVARDRLAAVQAAIAAHARSLVLDDGFQNFALAYRFSVLVVDGAVGFGNGKVLPAGPLRENIGPGLARASAVVILGDDLTGASGQIADFAAAAGVHLPVLYGRLEPDQAASAALRGRQVLAFAGIGRPAKFFETLEQRVGARIVDRASFPDHHPYNERQIAGLLERARKQNAQAVTTAKDFVRLPEAVRAEIAVLPVSVVWLNGGALSRLLAEKTGLQPSVLAYEVNPHG